MQGKSSSPNTIAASWSRHRSKKAGLLKLLWRGSTTWRSGRPSQARGRSIRKAATSSTVELAAGGERPPDRAELRVERGQALSEKLSNAVPGVGEARAGGAEARALDRELEVVGDGGRPIGLAGGGLATVEGGVDLDRPEDTRRMFELAALGGGRQVRTDRTTGRRSSRRCGSCSSQGGWRGKGAQASGGNRLMPRAGISRRSRARGGRGASTPSRGNTSCCGLRR